MRKWKRELFLKTSKGSPALLSTNNPKNIIKTRNFSNKPPPQTRKKIKTEEGVSYRISSFHKKRMSADKTKIWLQIFYEALKASCVWKVSITGRRFLHNIILAKRRGGSSAKILFSLQKKCGNFKITAFFETEKKLCVGGGGLEGITWRWKGEFNTKFALKTREEFHTKLGQKNEWGERSEETHLLVES